MVRAAPRLPIVPASPAKLPAVTSWDDFQRQAPDLADAVRARLTATLHTVLGTLRADGAPRLTGLEVHFGEGELWLAMMPDSRKADDLRRIRASRSTARPTCRWSTGRQGRRPRDRGRRRPTRRFAAALPQELPPSGMALFRADLTEASLARVEGDNMVIDIWHDGGRSVRQVQRQ